MNVTNIYLSRHEDVTELAKRIGKDMGSLDLLTTDDKENIVAAINELKGVMYSVEADLGDYATKQELTQAIIDLINDADADSDTLKELADKITALAQADNGLVNALEPQDFNETQKQQARDNIDAASKADLANLQLGLTEEQVRAIIEEYHPPKVEQGPASEYPGIGWYKATDTGIVYNKGVPEGETHIFEGDPTEYISVWRSEGLNPETFEGTLEDGLKLLEWHKNLHRHATSNVTDMGHWMYAYGNVGFYDEMGISADSVITDPVDISHYDTSNVTNMEFMFTIAPTFNQPLDNFDTSNVTNMVGMFHGASTFNQDLSQWCVANIPSEPQEFLAGTEETWTLPKPSWGTCPRGEDQA